MYYRWWNYRCGKVGVRWSVQIEEGRGGGNMGVRTKKRKKRRRRRKHGCEDQEEEEEEEEKKS